MAQTSRFIDKVWPFVDDSVKETSPDPRRLGEYLLGFAYVAVIVVVTVFAVIDVSKSQYEPVVEDGLNNICSLAIANQAKGTQGNSIAECYFTNDSTSTGINTFRKDSTVAAFCQEYSAVTCSTGAKVTVDCNLCSAATDFGSVGFAFAVPGICSDPAIIVDGPLPPSKVVLYPLATEVVCSGLRELSTLDKLNNALAKIGGYLGLTFAVLLAIKKYLMTPLNCINSVNPYVATNNIQMQSSVSSAPV